MKKYLCKVYKVTAVLLALSLLAAGCGIIPAETEAPVSREAYSLPTAVNPAVETETESAAAEESALPETPPEETEASSLPPETSPEESASSESTPEETAPPTLPPETTPAETTPEETAAPTKEGLWSEVPTEEANWATRAVSDIIYVNADFGFSTYVSPYDFDGDGIEDQADILQGAKDYVATRPVYDSSAYYAGGWPNDGRGVCTDVLAFALLAAGYDLHELVSKDVAMRPGAYPEGAGDSNIDYRRTRNLLPFMEEYFEKLTIDPYDYEAWQPGDIVLFESPEHGMWPGHVAIVSDRRASDGLPYLIHHTNNDRYSYEEDYLTTPRRIIKGHYRVGNLGASILYQNP